MIVALIVIYLSIGVVIGGYTLRKERELVFIGPALVSPFWPFILLTAVGKAIGKTLDEKRGESYKKELLEARSLIDRLSKELFDTRSRLASYEKPLPTSITYRLVESTKEQLTNKAGSL